MSACRCEDVQDVFRKNILFNSVEMIPFEVVAHKSFNSAAIDKTTLNVFTVQVCAVILLLMSIFCVIRFLSFSLVLWDASTMVS